MLEIDDSTGNIVKSYVYANDLVIAQYDGPQAAAAKYYYIHDRIGSVRQVIDVNGSIKHLYNYGPFGKTLEAYASGLAPGNPFRFTGQFFDNEISQYYLRARQYDPEIARFTGRDSVLGGYGEPLTLHSYLYCLNDPIDRTDLTGEFSMADTMSSMANGASRVANAYDIGDRVLGMARQLVQGVSMHNILLGVAIDIAADKVGGKMLDSFVDAAKGLGKFRRKLARKAGKGHHAAPMWAGGNPIQDLVGKADGLSDKLHTKLESKIRREMKDLGIQIGGRGGAAQDIARKMAENPNLQQDTLNKLVDIYRDFDQEHGTKLVGAFWDNWLNKIHSAF
ncbi:MAG: RHS repeat-associated core domain-containing protein [Phycisphaerae bacterium]|nr:RHS repeat-associated core domain-containing protein [Phycisphaerae bacterium]